MQGQMNRILCVSNQIYAGPHPIMINPEMYSKEGWACPPPHSYIFELSFSFDPKKYVR